MVKKAQTSSEAETDMAKVNVESVLKDIAILEAQGAEMADEVHRLAVLGIRHASAHHDFRIATRLVKAVEGMKFGRPKALIYWFETFSPMSWTETPEGMQFKRNAEKTDYLWERANGKPYWDLTKEKDIKPMTLEMAKGILINLTKGLKGESKRNPALAEQAQELLEIAAIIERDMFRAIDTRNAKFVVASPANETEEIQTPELEEVKAA